MILKRILSVFLVCFAAQFSAQPFNQTDASGQRQGEWRKFHVDSEDLFYTGNFKDDKPTGVFTYYYKDGKTKGKMDYERVLGQIYAEIFHKNGNLMAKGKYVGAEKKDSTWVYYNPSKVLKSKDNWTSGVKNGQEITYFPDGSTAEIVHWEEGLKNGEWKQYFSKDKLMVEGGYVDDKYEGMMKFYFPNGKVEVEGKYIGGLRDGSWYHYNDDGSIYMQTLYNTGTILREKKVTGIFQEYTDDGIMISELTYLQGKKQGPFKIYHDGASWSIEKVFDEKIGETLDKRVVIGHQIQMSGNYKDDQMDGSVKHYNKAGVLTKEVKYIAGEIVQ